MNTHRELAEFILSYDPLAPQPLRALAPAAATTSTARLPNAVPWPAGAEPVAETIDPPPPDTAPLPTAEVLVVTWTVAEARALAALFTPGAQLEAWHAYRHQLDAFLPKVTGAKAPFNLPSMGPRNFHTLGLYHRCRIGDARVLCFKSGLHMDFDGPALPVKDLWLQIIAEVKPRLIITTGTGGGIGADIRLGDVVVGAGARFFCTDQFKDAPWREQDFASSPLPPDTFAAITPAMLQANAAAFAEANPAPIKLVYPGAPGYAAPRIVSTDTFAFDDTLNSANLQGRGQACDMGDAVLGLALSEHPEPPKWVAIRNASDGQMDGTLPKAEQLAEANRIYTKYGMYTSAGSIVATWAVIRALTAAD